MAAAIYYFVFYKKEEVKVEPVSKPKVEQPKVEPQPEPEPVKVEVPKAELITISARQGRYFAVVGSFFDGDLAEDKGNELVASGITAHVLKPIGNVNFHRVGIMIPNVSSMKEAETALASYREKFGKEVWALKY